MNILLDTNIFILITKNDEFKNWFKRSYGDFDKSYMFTSSVVLGELDSIAKQNQWGNKRKAILKETTSHFEAVHTGYEEIISIYGDIDAYSQGKLKGRPLPTGMSARNMGKNDLWIAATAAALGAELLSTDKDFLHLHEVFFRFRFVDVEQFR